MSLVDLPLGVRASIEVYLISDKLGAEVCLALRNLPKFPTFDGDVDAHALITSLGLQGEFAQLAIQADDWRVMTPAEIVDYRADNQNEDD